MPTNEPNDNNTGIRKFLIGAAIIFSVVVLFNLLSGLFSGVGTKTVTYDEFLTALDEGRVAHVQVETDRIYYDTKIEKDGQAVVPEIFLAENVVGRFDDPDLVDRLTKAGVIFTTSIPEQSSPILQFIMTFILPTVILVAVFSLIMRAQSKRMNSGAMSFGKNTAKIYGEKTTGVTFADVAGQEEAKESLAEIIDYLKHPSKYASIGAKLPKGALLVGPPGTGKTLLAKAVAGEAGVPFFALSGSDFVEMFVGVGASRVRDLFKQAMEKAPCIVFIDEIDAIGKSRGNNTMGGNDEREQTLNQLLAEMDGFDSSKGVVILAATNRPEVLDPALLRPGRFDRRVIVDKPDYKGRLAVLAVHARDVKMGEDVNLEQIARMTPGAVGADLANMINEAALRAVSGGRSIVLQEDLVESVETVIAGKEKKDRILSPQEKRLVAVHEAGHALVGLRVSGHMPVQKITIVPRTMGSLGYVIQTEESEKFLYSKEELQSRIVTLTAGRAAEWVTEGKVTTGASNDIEKATEIARSMVTQYGMSDEFGMVQLGTQNNPYLNGRLEMTCSPETSARVDKEVRRIVEEAYTKAVEVVTADRQRLETVAEALVERETLTGDEFMRILGEEPMGLAEG